MIMLGYNPAGMVCSEKPDSITTLLDIQLQHCNGFKKKKTNKTRTKYK